MGTRYRGRAAEVRALNAYIKLMRAADSVQAPLERRLEAQGLTDGQFGVLEILFHLGSRTAGELGRKSFRSAGHITTVLDNLERRGLVKRTRSLRDRRSVIVSLTTAGAREVGRVLPGHVAAIAQAFRVLTPREQVVLERLLRKLGLGQESTRPKRR